MTHRSAARLARASTLLLCASLLVACSDEDVTSPGLSAACPADDFVGGVCAGAPQQICDGGLCTDDVSCPKVVSVSDDQELQSATFVPGTCVSLAPGTYGPVGLPLGVSLLGPGAGLVHVEGLNMGGGLDSAVLRGVTVGTGGLFLDGNVRVEATRVLAAGDGEELVVNAGVLVLEGAQVELSQVTVDGSTRHGVYVGSGATLSMQASIVSGSEGPGVWASCLDQGCACAPADRPQLTITDSIIRDNRLAGVAMSATDAVISNTDILRTRVGDAFYFGQGGGGLSVAECSSIDAKAMLVQDNASFGVLVDDSNAILGGPDTAHALEVSNNLRGVWLQNIAESAPATANLENITLSANAGVGLGFGGGEVGIIIICKTAVNDTELALLPVFENAMDLGTSQSLGDGMEWLGGGNVELEEVSLSGNARASILIDGPATGTLVDVTLSGGDELKGIVQQSYDGIGPQPTIVSNVPAISTAATEQFAVSKPPTAVSPL